MRRGIVIFGIELTTDQLIFYGLLALMSLVSMLAGLYLYFRYTSFVQFLNETGLTALLTTG
ncbi:MAG: hypothetical protein GXO07_01455 [Crenarchaeota archaeon]|nr:hypothetical protein [Thermoproteota archaeon]